MITVIAKTYGSDAAGNKHTQQEYYGKSTDDKAALPAPAKNADIFYEMDSGAVFMYDQDGAAWLEQ